MHSWLLLARGTLRRAAPSWDKQPRVLCKHWLPVLGEQRSSSGRPDHGTCQPRSKYRGRHYAFQNRAGWPDRRSLPAGRYGQPVQRWSKCTTTSVASGPSCTRRSEPGHGLNQKLLQGTEFRDCTSTGGSHQRSGCQGLGPRRSRRLANLLPMAEQMLQELEEEARASWEERAVYYASCMTNLAGEAFETLDKTK